MALTLGDNFSYQGAKPLDGRLKYDTVAAMKAMADSTLYDGCLAYCVATDKTYQWKSTNEVDVTLGRWREFESGTTITVDDELSDTSENPVQNAVIKEALDGKADLVDGKVPAAQLPSYVDDVLEYEDRAHFPATGEAGKIYVALDTNKTYRWSGSAYTEISESLALGETSSAAYRGDRGKIAYDVSQTVGDVTNLKTANKSSVVAAINEVAGVNAHSGFTPIGTVIRVTGIHTPQNYLECDGAIYNIDDYSDLATYFETEFGNKNKFGGDGITTFGVPDLSSEFPVDSIYCIAYRNIWTDAKLMNIQVTTPPTKTTYFVGQPIDVTGMVVKANWTSGAAVDVTLSCTFSPAAGTVAQRGTTEIVVSYTTDGNTFITSQAITVEDVGIYGVEWDGSSTTLLSRTDAAASYTNPVPYVAGATNYGSPFDDLMPWSGIERVSNSAAGELVKIPKFWYKTTFSGNTFKLQIADAETDGFSVAPAFMDRGDGKGERDFVYVGRYHCSSSNYRSATGVTPKVNITRDAARTGIKALGSGIWQWDYAMLITIQMLYLVEYANWNVQATIGGGCSQTSASSSAMFNCGGTDSMPYHTGTVSANHTDYGDCQYRYIENLWGNCHEWADGIYFSGANIYVVKNPANFSDTANGTLVGTRPTSGGWISALAKSSVNGFDWFYYPSAVAGADGTYIPDYCDYYASGVVLVVGGNYNQNPSRGLFFLHGNYAASCSYAHVGSRLQYLP